ncbi:MAG: PAC2 family protein [Actinomycetes bacterium]
MAYESDRPLFSILEDVTLNEPTLVISLEGWVDAGLGASAAMSTILSSSATELLATFDGDTLLDQRARRPVVRIVDGITTSLTWPEIQLRVGVDRQGQDVLYLIGPEPDVHWGAFVSAVVDLAHRYDVRLVVGMGAFPAPAPHTRPVRLAATAPASSARLLEHVGLVTGELEVPAGVTSAIELGFEDTGIDMITLWARVPHYVAAMPFPQASVALVEGLAEISGLDLDTADLIDAADASRRQVDELVASNPEHLAMVRALETSLDATEGNPLGVDHIPTGDELAAELEQFLRGENG